MYDVWGNHKVIDRTFTFEYDNNGNILFKNTCPLTSAEEPALGNEECCCVGSEHGSAESSYEYCEEGNRDRLLRFGNGPGNEAFV